MCGIAGFVRKKPGRLDELLDQMLASIRRRGPDGKGSFVEEQFAIGMTRLAIIDLETGDQPIFNEDKSVVVVCNGEIYNYADLRKNLEGKGHRFSTNSDVEVIVHLYEEMGPEFVNQLDGMFAYAIYDRIKKQVVIGRDRLGIKPLFVACTDQSVVFGSEIKVLLQDESVSKDLDLQALDEFIAYNYVPYPRTIYRCIKKLEPGHYMIIDGEGSCSKREYWSVTDDRFSDEALSTEEWRGRLETEIKSAVSSHMVSDVPVGVFLSGGVDSSLIAALAAESTNERLQSFTIAFKDAGKSFIDERLYANQLVKKYGFRHTELEVEPSFEEIEDYIVQAFDEPFADDSVIPTYYLCELTARNVKVALSGLGGDELFAGYPRHKGVKYLEQYRRLPKLLRENVVARAVNWLPESNESNPKVDHLKRFVKAAELSGKSFYRNALAPLESGARQSLFARDVAGEIDSLMTDEVIESRFSIDGGDLLAQALLVDQQTYLVDDVLTLTDRLSMWHSLEVRVPFLDHRFVKLANSVPTSLKIRRNTQKSILKDIARKHVPDAILDHRKQGFESPMSRWLRGPLRPLVEDRLSPEKLRQQGIFDPTCVQELWTNHLGRKSQNSKSLFALLIFQAWIEAKN